LLVKLPSMKFRGSLFSGPRIFTSVPRTNGRGEANARSGAFLQLCWGRA